MLDRMRAGPEHTPLITNPTASMQITKIDMAETWAWKAEVFTNKGTMLSELDK